MKECLWCKAEFEPNKPKQKFCKLKCKTYYHRSIDSSKKTPDPYVILSTGELLIKDEEMKQKALMFLAPKENKITTLDHELLPEIKCSSAPTYDCEKIETFCHDEPKMYKGWIPKTVQEIKDMCPEDLTGIDRTIWIGEQKKKYNIL